MLAFNVAPVLYTTIGAYQEIRFETKDTSDKARINAIVTRGTVEEVPDELTATKISDFINELPGYSAQVLTFWVYDRLLDRHLLPSLSGSLFMS